MKKNLFISIVAILIGGFFALSVVADDKHDHNTLVKFKGGIGVIPVSNVRCGTAATAEVSQPEHCPRSPTSRSDLDDQGPGCEDKIQWGHQGRRQRASLGWRQYYRKGDGTECLCHADL